MKRYWYVLIAALLGGTVTATNFREEAYRHVSSAGRDWGAAISHISSALKGMPAYERPLFEDLDHKVFSLEPLFDSVHDLAYVELVLALANVAQRAQSDCSGEWGKLWKLHPDRLVRAERARIMFYLTSPNHPLRGIASETTRHRFIDTEWLQGNWWLVENITQKLYEDAPYTAKQLTKRACVLKHANALSSQLPAHEAAEYASLYKERTEFLQMQTAITHYIPYQYVVSHEAELAEKCQQPHLVTFVTERPMLRFQSGSHNLISHIGFVFAQGTTLMLRHAHNGSVQDTPLAAFIEESAAQKRWDNTLHGLQFVRIKPFHEQGRG